MMITACSGAPDRTSPPAKAPADLAPLSEVVGPDGATLTFDQLTVDIPPGALSATVTVTIEAEDRPSSSDAFGPWYELGPTGIVFDRPVTLTLALDEADVPAGEPPVIAKYLAHPAYESNAQESTYLLLETTYDGAGTLTAETIGFSHVGGYIGVACLPARPPVIKTASYDSCDRDIILEWDAEAPTFIEFGYRQQPLGTPVTWAWGWTAPATTDRLVIPAPVLVPGPNQPAYTFVAKLHTVYACSNTVSGDVVAEIPGIEIVGPDAPESVSATAISASEISVRWRDPSAIESQEDGYEISRAPSWASGPQTRDAGLALRYDDTDDVQSGVGYTYYVRAYRQVCGRRYLSGWATGSTNGRVPSPPPATSLTAQLVAGAVQLDWALASGATEYVLSRTGGAAFADVVLQHPTTTYADTSVEPDTTYVYTLTPRNAAGDGPPASATLTTPVPAAGENVCGNLRVRVSPVMQTMQVQPEGCIAGVDCPPNAVFDVEVERLNGATGEINLRTSNADGPSWPYVELALGAFSGGGLFVTLTGTGAETATLEVRAPEYAVQADGRPLPLVWNIAVLAAFSGDPMECAVPMSLTVTP